jgi:hypothetical protein
MNARLSIFQPSEATKLQSALLIFIFVCLFVCLRQMWWGGIHSELDAAIQDLLDAGHYLHFLDFGDDGSYFVSYD